jgi:hypothetical protein
MAGTRKRKSGGGQHANRSKGGNGRVSAVAAATPPPPLLLLPLLLLLLLCTGFCGWWLAQQQQQRADAAVGDDPTPRARRARELLGALQAAGARLHSPVAVRAVPIASSAVTIPRGHEATAAGRFSRARSRTPPCDGRCGRGQQVAGSGCLQRRRSGRETRSWHCRPG